LPLSRYIGAWVYPTVGADFKGIEPESVDLIVREDTGFIQGTMTARFRLARNSPIEPVVRFTFEGALQSTRNQAFPLVTSNGAKGTIELIPTNAFNLIEITISTEDKPNTVRQADFLLIKK
jgi:hypothetical protein